MRGKIDKEVYLLLGERLKVTITGRLAVEPIFP